VAGVASKATPHAGTIGTVVQVLGAVVDIEFPADQLPGIYNAVEVQIQGQKAPLVLEVEQQLGNNWVRCVAMGPTDGMQRGDKGVDTGGPITMPVGPETLGRIFNVVGQPIDNKPAPPNAPRLPIHRAPPTLEDQATNIEVL
jgi:F-type H+-transporting ATPase subunit beta